MAADITALQQLINKITELQAALAEAEISKEKLDHRMAEALVAGAEPAGAMFRQLKSHFFDPVTREVEALKVELASLQKLMVSGGQLALPSRATSGAQAGIHGTDDIASRRKAIARESDTYSSMKERNYLTEYFEKWRDIGKIIPEVTHELKEFYRANKLDTAAAGSALEISDDYIKMSGSITEASGAVRNFSYSIDRDTGLREYSGTIEHTNTNGIVEKFSKTMDSTGKKVSASMQEGFDPETFSAWGKQADKVLRKMGDLGFTTENLRDVQEEASTGIRRYQFAMRDAEGIMKRATITTDKWGNILQDTQKRFRGFLSTIVRNTKEVLKWTVAVQLTYKPLMKMYELVEIMIENEAKLADITIALGESYESLNDIFMIAADVAEQTGSSIKGVLEGYELAYRATGGIVDSTERAAAAQQLLIDSMLLSKVSTLDQALALDTLAGGLLQIGEELDQGRSLLDKWVAVSKRANVSIATLAESFAITSASARGAGISLDELNGIIATVAENTTLSATEAGNAVRAFISGFQTDTAVRELTKFGVLVRDSSQENLDFLNVMNQVKDLFDAKLISESQLNEIAEAIGGGARRGAQVVAFLKNLNRVQEVAAASALAQGDAQDALNIKMETLTTKATELENAFIKFGQALGTEGGLISGAKLALESFTGILNVVTSITNALGTAIPVMLAYGAAMSQVQKRGGMLDVRQAMAGGLGYEGAVQSNRGLATPIVNKLNALLTSSDKIGKNTAGMKESFGKFVAGPGFGMATGLGFTGLMVAGSLAAGEEDRAKGQAIGGGIVALLTGSPIGAIIGASIGGALVDYVYGEESEFRDFFAGIGLTEDEEGSGISEAEKLRREQQRLTDAITSSAGEWRSAFAEWQGHLQKFFIPDKGADLTRAQAALVSLSKQGRNEELEEYYERLNDLKEREQILQGVITESLPLYKTRNALVIEHRGLIDQLTQEYKDLAFEERLAGKITNKQFNEINQILGSLDINVGGYVAAFGDDYIKLSADVSTTAEAFEKLTLALTHGNQADITYLSGLLVDVAMLQKEIAGGKDVQANTAKLFDTSIKGARAIDLILRNIMKTSFQLPTMIEMFGLSQKEAQLVVERASMIRDGIDKEVADAGLGDLHTEDEFKNIFGEIMLRVGQHGGTMLIEGLSEANVKEAMKELGEEGIISMQETFGLMDFSDLTAAQFKKLAAESVRLGKLAEDRSGGMLDLDWKEIGAINSDVITGPITVELTILQALMKDLIEVSEDQVEGIYNLPTDGTFFVPFEGYAKGFGGGGGVGSDDFMNKFEMWMSQFPQDVQDVFVTNYPEGEGPVSGYVPEKTLEDYFGPMLGPQKPPTLEDYFGPMLGPPTPEGYTYTEPEEKTWLDKIGNFTNDMLDGFFTGLDWVLDKLTPDFGKKEEELPKTTGQGALYSPAYAPPKGLGDIAKSLANIKSWDDLVYYFQSGRFGEDAMRGAATPEESFENVIKILQGLEMFRPYEEGEGIFAPLLDPLRDILESLGLGATTEDGTQPTSYLGDSVADLVTATQLLNETGQLALTLEVNSNTNLTMDSQVIGTAVKQFVYEEMLKREGSSSSATTKTFTM